MDGSGQLSELGYSVIPGLLEPEEVDTVSSRIQELPTAGAGRRRLIELPWCEALARRVMHDARVSAMLPTAATVAQCTLFSKSPDTNWLVPLHQDLSIPVAERVASPLCSGWSEKEGETFVQPPVSVLQETVSVRVHIDDCDERNGALRVVPGSHQLGRLGQAETHRLRDERGVVSVSVPRGGAMLMRPLLLHASSKASTEKPRRVLHFVFGPGRLPEGLRWKVST